MAEAFDLASTTGSAGASILYGEEWWQADGTIGFALRRAYQKKSFFNNADQASPPSYKRHRNPCKKNARMGHPHFVEGRQTADKGGALAPSHLHDLTPTLSLG